MEPIAFGWVDDDVSTAPEWDRAQVRRLAHRLGYRIIWPVGFSALSVADQARSSGADVVILPAPDHLGPLPSAGHIEDGNGTSCGFRAVG